MRVKVPAFDSPLVSANIPSLPDILRSLVLMVMLPPSPVLVAFFPAVALISVPFPMVTVWELISMFPA